MPAVLEMLDAEAVRKLPGMKTVPEFEAKFATTTTRAAESRAAVKVWADSLPAVKVPQPEPKVIRGVPVTTEVLDRLRAVTESRVATAELVSQSLGPDQTLGLVYSSLATLEYIRLQAERQTRLAAARDRRVVDAEWQQVVAGAAGALAAAGLPRPQEADLDRMATELNRRRPNFNAVATIASSARDSVEARIPRPTGTFLTHAAVVPDTIPVVTAAPRTLCDQPIQGSFTRHFSQSFSLNVRLTVWCPTWTNPFKTCTRTFTLAGVSFSIDLGIGYRINCCGATAWGQAAGQACGTVVGVKVCASCSARVTAVSGVSRTGSGSNCSYGLGLLAELRCSFGGIDVLRMTVPFGWTITGPCPPPALRC